ncbi:MAG: LapA family protein [Candidatus Krumholzibacteriia bacterium]|nr:LapA family protein [bacterium]MCB9513660.1 LapA family protein [Candidatus Latescibacterota bacterium]MCB9515497.1 LapA family protein [Candidatus Latescibacterota bacterium]
MRRWLIAVLLVFILLVALQNMGEVTLRFLVWETRVSGVLVYLALFALGFLGGWIAGHVGRRRAAAKVRPAPPSSTPPAAPPAPPSP